MIGQFSGSYSPARTLLFVAKLFRDLYRQIFSTYIANESLKLSFILNCVLKRANDLETIIKLICFALDLLQKFEAVPHE